MKDNKVKLDDTILKMKIEDFDIYITTLSRACIIAVRAFVQSQISSINDRMRSLERSQQANEETYIKAGHKRMHLTQKSISCDKRLSELKPSGAYHLLVVQFRDGHFEYIPTSKTLLESVDELMADHAGEDVPGIVNHIPLNEEQFMEWAAKTQTAFFRE